MKKFGNFKVVFFSGNVGVGKTAIREGLREKLEKENWIVQEVSEEFSSGFLFEQYCDHTEIFGFVFQAFVQASVAIKIKSAIMHTAEMYFADPYRDYAIIIERLVEEEKVFSYELKSRGMIDATAYRHLSEMNAELSLDLYVSMLRVLLMIQGMKQSGQELKESSETKNLDINLMPVVLYLDCSNEERLKRIANRVTSNGRFVSHSERKLTKFRDSRISDGYLEFWRTLMFEKEHSYIFLEQCTDGYTLAESIQEAYRATGFGDTPRPEN